MVLADPGPLLTPPPSSSPPKTPHRSYSDQTRSQNEEKNLPPKPYLPLQTRTRHRQSHRLHVPMLMRGARGRCGPLRGVLSRGSILGKMFGARRRAHRARAPSAAGGRRSLGFAVRWRSLRQQDASGGCQEWCVSQTFLTGQSLQIQ
jgi:hypothetical protein